MTNALLSNKSSLSSTKQAVLEKLLKAKNQVYSEKIQSKNDSIAPLSFAQQRLWLLCQLESENSAYNIPTAIRLSGKLDYRAMEKAFNAIIKRHAILRTKFVMENEQPRQMIIPEVSVNIPVEDISGSFSESMNLFLQDIIYSEGIKAFDLKDFPLFRFRLLYLGNKTGEKEYIFLITMHHIISDGWSAAILFREFSVLYSAYCNETKSLLPDLAIQYADFASWQRKWLQGARLEKQLNYWREQLNGSPTLLKLPIDHPRPSVQNSNGKTYKFSITSNLAKNLNLYCQQKGLTLFSVLISTLNILLYRYGGQSDINIGIPVANRNRFETESLIGFFVNTLVIRSNLSGNPCLIDFLEKVNQTSIDALEHQDLPFEKLVETIQPERDLSYSPVFQVMFVLHNVPLGSLNVDGLVITPLDIDYGTTKFDLVLHATELNGWIEAAFEYNTDLFEQDTIMRLAVHYESLLKSIVESPDVSKLSELSLLLGEERSKTLHEWNDTQADYPKNKCLHHIFEERAEINPNKVAVVYKKKTIKYKKLNEDANRLANYLRSEGVKPEMQVAICIDRSLEMIVGLLGILKAGGCYVPIDPSYPKKRITHLLIDSRSILLLTKEPLLARLPKVSPKTICLDSAWGKISKYSKENLSSKMIPENSAYMIYTSGSTGKSKGVVISHRNIVNSTYARLHYYQEPIDCFLLLSSFAFDSSVAGIFWTLIQGGKLCISSDEMLADSSVLVECIVQDKVTHLLALPAFYNLLLEHATRDKIDSLGTVILAGDVCPSIMVNQHYAKFPQVELYNEYGPTETTVWCSVYQTKAFDEGISSSIGKPISNIQIYILDKCLSPVPVGVNGEIYIGGGGVARGYFEQPKQTAMQFVPNFFRGDGSRLYKTGDLARFSLGGNIEFLGRTDYQVKIRGFRIELTEIEAQLLQCQQIKDAVVMAREDQPGEKRLVAYIVCSAQVQQDAEYFRTILKKNLPTYMLPSMYIFMDELPLNPNGKLDRNALPALGSRHLLATEYIAPRSQVEQRLAQLWSDVLGVEEVGVHDDFFGLGGHSILATQLLFKIRESFSCNLPLLDLFQSPTLASQAQLLVADNVNEDSNVDSIDWKEEARLDDSIRPDSQYHPISNIKSIFLTGATGYLGVFLLKELLQQTSIDIYCLVRSSTSEQGFEKIKRSLEDYGLWDNDYASKIYPVCGDLSKAHLGIQTSQWQQLVEVIDVIYHNGALVNFIYPYSTLKPANVIGTQEVLRLACTEKIKPVHYISTVSIFKDDLNSDSEKVVEDDFPEDCSGLIGGYAQSKWVAEKIVRVAGKRGIPVCIFRPAQISGHSQTGVWNTGDFICRMIKAYVDVGYAPTEWTGFDIAPVDYVSKAIVYLSSKHESRGQTFHLNNPNSVSNRLIIDVLRAERFKLDLVSMQEWINKIDKEVDGSPEHPLYPLVFLLTKHISDSAEEAHSPHFSCKKTVIALRDSGVVCPDIDNEIVHRYIAYFIRINFLNPPLHTANDSL
ncbi:hypothetical protein AU255_00700 [Methyloprofundus sedimenti]|uniref:Carrier domain-containing protein n=1 Tax=Methyloprofundus sedimenti TaxID=1420851 RepID=A0A1V8M4G9_9GAMM|nr:non-ribosomal peptide synthetase [Methyloprofundus sedimenti]OQK16460.1 hypothetical protein AU255_00700 [Methyloprofundus sedimenti]